DAQVEVIPMQDCPAKQLRSFMKIWFFRLVNSVAWLRHLADHGDDTLAEWDKDGFLESVPPQDLIREFTAHETILSTLLYVEFGSFDKRLERRKELRERHDERLMGEAMQYLLGEDVVHGEIYDDGHEHLEEVTDVVRLAAHHLGMSTENIQLAPSLTKKLDQTGLVRRLAQKGNMSLRLVTLEEDWYTKDCGIMIGWYKRNPKKAEPVSILPEAPGKYILETAKRERIPVTGEIAGRLVPDALACYAGLPARKLSLQDLFRFMLQRSWKTDLRIILIVSLLAGLVPLVTPIITETIFKDIIPILDRQGLATVTQVSVVTSFTLAGFSVCRSIALLRITTNLDMAVEAALWGRLLQLPTGFFRRFTSGELANRMMGLENAKNILSGAFTETMLGLIFSFWSILLMCYYSLKLTAVALVIWGLCAVLEFFVLRNNAEAQKKFVEAKNATAGIVQQIFAGLSKFRIQGSETQAYYLWSKRFGREWIWNQTLRIQNNYSVLLTTVQPLVLTFALYYIAYSDSAAAILAGKPEDAIPYSTFMAFSAAYTGLNATLTKAIPMMSHVFALRPLLDNLRPILEETPEGSDDRVDADVLSGALEVQHLSFSYQEDTPDVLRDVSFTVKAGENLAIVGKSGCGKSTLLRLILGFERPRQGAIVFDGQDLAELNPTSVRSQMGIVLQNGQLMTGDILTNIVGQSTLTADDAWAAAEAVGIAEDIRQMPMGMQTMISEGSGNISGGQRQRILIARALAANPAIIVFDEATSALDNRAQAIVTESLNRLKATRIVVAHRLSTIRECDRILVLDQGRIAESGTFEELANKGGIFAQLVKRQVA
ncbi:MAG: NHLP bacteriocin export ABC transporter permease/ATPase subunit, partial [Selenomonadaceae bacterium]|nr:NHLP bacteriocin export ABC transporter permease/ATPase subunit [Selenomonadaceae bacterium]